MPTRTEMVTVIAACLAAAAAVGGFGYFMGRDTATSEVSQLNRELELLKSAHGVENALDYLADLSTYNDQLFRFSEYEEKIAERNEKIAALSTNISTLEQDVDSLRDQLSLAAEIEQTSRKEIADLSDSLAIKYELEDTVSLIEGQSHSFLDGAVLVGVQNTYSNRAVITLKNETEFIDVGEGVEVQVDDARCLVALRSTSRNAGATLDLTCRAHRR